MRGLDRNIRLAVRNAGKITLMTYGISVLLTLWFLILRLSESDSVDGVFALYLEMSVLIGTLFITAYMGQNMSTDFQQALTYGSTRKCAALGMIFFAGAMALMQIVVNTAVLLILAAASPSVAFDLRILADMLVNYLLAVGLGIFTAAAAIRFGKIGYYIPYVVIIVAVYMGAATYMSAYMKGAGADSLPSVSLAPLLNLLKLLAQTEAEQKTVYLIALLAGAALVVLAGSWLVHATKETEVRV